MVTPVSSRNISRLPAVIDATSRASVRASSASDRNRSLSWTLFANPTLRMPPAELLGIGRDAAPAAALRSTPA